jgi:CubicO group peptidase (beta-lactamase class C family)
MLRKSLAALAVLASLAGCATAAPRPAPDAPRPCPAALSAWEDAGFSGVVAMSTAGEQDCVTGYGLADRAAGTPNTADTVFAIGSVTKSFTAAAVFSLVDEGKVELDAPVRQYLPELSGPVGDATVRQLLLHTSGLTGTHGSDYEPMTSDAALAAINELELAFPPGEEYLYSNAGYTVLALVVERFAGYRDLMASRILPSGTGFWSGEPAPRGPRAVGYLEGGGEGETGDFAGPYWGMEGNGGVAMTMPELASWTHALFTGQVVSDASTEAIASPGVDTGDGQAETPGWVAVDESVLGTPALAAAGGGGTGHNVVVAWLPEPKRVVAIASNGPDVSAEDLLSAIAPALVAGEPLPRPPSGDGASADTTDIVGTYTLATGGSFEVTVDGTRPVIAATGVDAVPVLFPPRDGFAGHEDLVGALLAGRTREGREEREQLETSFGPVTEVIPAGTIEHDRETRTYVTIVAGGRPVLGWYSVNAHGGIEAAEVPTSPPSLRLVADGAGFRPDDPAGTGPDVTVEFGDGELTVTGPGGPVSARLAG